MGYVTSKFGDNVREYQASTKSVLGYSLHDILLFMKHAIVHCQAMK